MVLQSPDIPQNPCGPLLQPSVVELLSFLLAKEAVAFGEGLEDCRGFLGF